MFTFRTLPWRLPFFAVALSLLSACGDGNPDSNTNVKPPMISQDDFAALEKAKFFFMHQSVGSNLLDGVEKLGQQAGIDAPVVKLDGKAPKLAMPGNGLAHAYGGKNREPLTKIRAFGDQLDRFAPEQKPEYAFMKFCFIDFDENTNVDQLFNEYITAVKQIQARHPDVKILHMTVPLMQSPSGMKNRIKRLLGMDVWIDSTNIKREQFSQKIRDTFPANQVFDIARFEATRPDGSMVYNLSDGHTPALVPEYTHDGSHLNDTGQRFVAARFLEFLNQLQ